MQDSIGSLTLDLRFVLFSELDPKKKTKEKQKKRKKERKKIKSKNRSIERFD